MLTGTVKYFNQINGFWLIKKDSTLDQIFVHHFDLIESVKDKDKVFFEIQ